jgi:hypothetical protein
MLDLPIWLLAFVVLGLMGAVSAGALAVMYHFAPLDPDDQREPTPGAPKLSVPSDIHEAERAELRRELLEHIAWERATDDLILQAVEDFRKDLNR